MQVHTLTPDRFDLLAQAPDGLVPNPALVTVIVAEDASGTLRGRRFLCLVPHVEGAWDADPADHATVQALESAVTTQVAQLGLAGVMRAAPLSSDLSRYGYEPLPLLLWVKRPVAQPADAPSPLDAAHSSAPMVPSA